jgi:hypothetical protein
MNSISLAPLVASSYMNLSASSTSKPPSCSPLMWKNVHARLGRDHTRRLTPPVAPIPIRMTVRTSSKQRRDVPTAIAPARTLSQICHNQVRIRRVNRRRPEIIFTGKDGSGVIGRQPNSASVRLGVKWSQVQILSARRRSEAIFESHNDQIFTFDPNV